MRNIENRNWSGRLTTETIEAIVVELRKMASEGDFVFTSVTSNPDIKPVVQVTVNETLRINYRAGDGSFSISTHNFVNCVGKDAFIAIGYDRFSIKQTSSGGNDLHWEFVFLEKGE